MINSLTGIISHKGPEGIHLSCGPIEWDIRMPLLSVQALPALGSETTIYTHLHHKEDLMRLYGFADPDERSLFTDLLKVTGVGPAQAVKILSGIGVERFVKAMEAGDVDTLSHIPGLGTKTAQKIILALKGKLSFVGEEAAPAGNEIVDSLVEMGFDRRKAQRAVEAVLSEIGADDEKEVFRKALVSLSTGEQG